MAITLAGGCRVTAMREGAPVISGTLRIWPQIGRAAGAQAISLRVLEFAQGTSPGLRNESCDEILYVLGWERGINNGDEQTEANLSATIFISGGSYEVGPATGIYLRPNETLTVSNHVTDPLVMISSRCPEPEDSALQMTALTPGLPQPEGQGSAAVDATDKGAFRDRSPIVRLAERRAIPTADRWYRVLVDEESGSTQVTQFVGSIPPGRAPNHFHNYEEVLFILRGEGRMWAGETNAPIAAGSCIYLPKGQVHCVENTGAGELRLLGVFYPAGSPSVRYDA